MLKTSIIVCTYNGMPYMREQLDSILNQDKLPDEIVIIDDCSQDASWEVICDYKRANAHVNIRIFRNEKNIGFVNNFSKAIYLASNDIVFFCDQDDVWARNKLSLIHHRFSRDPQLTCIHSNAEVVNNNLRPSKKDLFSTLKISVNEVRLMSASCYFPVLARRNVVTGATMAVRREYLISTLPIPAGWIHDEWIAIINSLCGKIAFVNDYLIKYRIHDKNTVGLGGKRRGRRRLFGRDSVDASYRERINKLSQVRLYGVTDSSQLEFLDGYVQHIKWRLSLSSLSPRCKIAQIFANLIDGSYSRFSRGIFSAVRDVFVF